MKGHLDDLSQENIRISKDFEEVKAKHDELLSRQKDMLEKTFTYIMMEVRSVDLGFVVPHVEKRVDKSAILKAIKNRRGARLFISQPTTVFWPRYLRQSSHSMAQSMRGVPLHPWEPLLTPLLRERSMRVVSLRPQEPLQSPLLYDPAWCNHLESIT